MVVAAKEVETRAAQRANTLLVADALVGNARWPVKVRNISRLGAMLETSATLDVKTQIVIARGSLQATGEIVWRRDNAFGVRFLEPTNVEQWIGVSTAEATNSCQHPSHTALHFCDPLTDDMVARRISEELDYIGRLATAVSTLLSEDPILRVRHCSRIQELVMAADMLEQLSVIVLSDDKMAAIESRATGPMRQRMLR